MPMLKSLARPAILFYSARLPYHPGKWRVVNTLLRASGIEELHRGKTYVVRRRGILWKLSPDCWVQRTVYYHGDWDTYEVREVLASLGPGMVFFDVGAYFGYYSMVVAHELGESVQVFAFEPFQANYDLLAENVGLNGFGNVRPCRFALSDQEGLAELEIPPAANRGSGRVVRNADGAPHETVRTTTLDGFVAENGVARLDVVKLDVEGAELAVLRGARESLARFRPKLVVELNPAALREHGADAPELLALLEELGYTTLRIDRSGLHPFGRADLDTTPELERGYVNLFCVPAGPASV